AFSSKYIAIISRHFPRIGEGRQGAYDDQKVAAHAYDLAAFQKPICMHQWLNQGGGGQTRATANVVPSPPDPDQEEPVNPIERDVVDVHNGIDRAKVIAAVVNIDRYHQNRWYTVNITRFAIQLTTAY
ncbi:hypothetical protein M8C21_010921, partial [Ambrosia artemisiifolia]